MRILILTNFYPPFQLGGQGISCQQVVEGLKNRGHEILVLTSTHGTDRRSIQENGIRRQLFLEMDLIPWRNSLTFFTHRRARERHDRDTMQVCLEEFQPDIVFVWGMWNLPRALPALAEAHPTTCVVYRFAEFWPTLPTQYEQYWRTPGKSFLTDLPKRLLKRLALNQLANEPRPALSFEHAYCVSAATRETLVQSGIPVEKAEVIHTGLNLEPYLPLREIDPSPTGRGYPMLYAGRLAREKGIESALQAIHTLVYEHGLVDFQLSLAGSGEEAYRRHLADQVATLGLKDHVHFLGRIPAEQMPEIYRNYAILLVPSIWPEPFARVVLEGMISGLVVVATPSGGTAEILVDHHNGLLFEPGIAEDLADQLVSLVGDPALAHRLAISGRETVLQRFTEKIMLDKIEAFLQYALSETAHVL